MLDVEFLLNRPQATHILYRYRSNTFRYVFRRHCEDVARAKSLAVTVAKVGELATIVGVFGVRDFIYCEVGRHYPAMSEEFELLQDVDHAFLAIPIDSPTFRSDSWRSLAGKFLVLDEPSIDRGTVEAVTQYALATSDLRPEFDLNRKDIASAALALPVQDLASFFRFVDEYILVGPEVVRHRRSTHRITPLHGVLMEYIVSPSRNTANRLSAVLLGRNADTARSAQDLMLTTARMLSRLATLDERQLSWRQSLEFWSVYLLVRHEGLWRQRRISRGPWSRGVDTRLFAVDHLLSQFEQLVSGDPKAAGHVALIPHAAKAMRLADEGAADAQLVLMKALKVAKERQGVGDDDALHATLERSINLAEGEDNSRGQFLPAVLDSSGLAVRHAHAFRRLCHINKGNLAGAAFLLVGPDECGNEELAGFEALAILCDNRRNGQPCLSCENCLAVNNRRSGRIAYADLRGQSAKHQMDLLEQVRDLGVAHSAYGRSAIAINGVDEVPAGKLDALLKLIEDAPRGASFVLMAERFDRVPPAIISRSFVFRLRA